ncbi:MAG TPA: hypothetical protein VKO43_08995, partial [Candidatus Krumholzibacteriaceae bacterium]|nr:hypothetical protein [Candidatus Krumholzibacteriaceae bacterium]
QTSWQTNKVNINLNSFIPFPLSRRDKYFYLMSMKTFSISSILFITFFSIVTIGFISTNFFVGVYAAILFFLFLILVDIWITNINLLFGKIFIKYKVGSVLILYLIIIPLGLNSAGIIGTSQLLFYIYKLPVLNWPGNGVYEALTGQWLNAGLNLLYIIAFSAVGYLLGIYMVKKKHCS